VRATGTNSKWRGWQELDSACLVSRCFSWSSIPKNPPHPPSVPKLLVEEDPILFPLPPPALEVLANDEGYDMDSKNIWAGNDGYNVWGAYK